MVFMSFSRGGAGVNVAKTLDLLKAVMQSSFNQEIKKLCDDYYQVSHISCLLELKLILPLSVLYTCTCIYIYIYRYVLCTVCWC